MANERMYLRSGNKDYIKGILKIRLHMWDVKRTTPKK